MTFGGLPILAQNGHGAMSELSPLSGVKRKSDLGGRQVRFGPEAHSD